MKNEPENVLRIPFIPVLQLIYMERRIVPVVHIKSLNQPESDFSYWKQQTYEARLTALEEIRREYKAWFDSQQEDRLNIQPGFQRVYRIIKR